MLNPGYTSINRVIENVIRDTGFTDEINFPDMVEWCFIAMELINTPSAYIKSITDGNKDLNHHQPVEIVDYRGELPCDFHKLIGVREYCSLIPTVSDSGIFLESNNAPQIQRYSNVTYKIEGSYIFTNISEGYLEIAYWAFPTDADGLPMIPDDVMYLRAVEAFLTERIARKLWIQGKMSGEVYSQLDRDWLFYVKSAKVRAAMPSYDEAESLKNQILRLVSKPNHADWNYSALSNSEQAYTGRFRRFDNPYI